MSDLTFKRSYLGNIKRGEKIPTLDTLLTIVNVLEISVDYLFRATKIHFKICFRPSGNNELNFCCFSLLFSYINIRNKKE